VGLLPFLAPPQQQPCRALALAPAAAAAVAIAAASTRASQLEVSQNEHRKMAMFMWKMIMKCWILECPRFEQTRIQPCTMQQVGPIEPTFCRRRSRGPNSRLGPLLSA